MFIPMWLLGILGLIVLGLIIWLSTEMVVPPSGPRRMLTIAEAAIYIGATNWFVEEACRNGELPSRIFGQRRVLDVKDLDKWIDAQPYAEPIARQKKRTA